MFPKLFKAVHNVLKNYNEKSLLVYATIGYSVYGYPKLNISANCHSSGAAGELNSPLGVQQVRIG